MYKNYKKCPHIHFVGIGGIGMSGIAIILKSQGYTISGCDTDIDQPNIAKLKSLGCPIHRGNNTSACLDPSIDILVYSSAITIDNPEIIAAQKRGVPTIPRALMLAELMRTKHSIAVAGSHGKTTTTSLISHILIEANMDPTVIIGGHLRNISTNARLGNGSFLIAEADESDRSLVNLHATLGIITNIDLEHLETYRDIHDIKATFTQFLNNIPFYGKAIVCIDDAHVRSMLPMPHLKTLKYGTKHQADIRAIGIELQADKTNFTVVDQSGAQAATLGTATLSMPGKHNMLNALAAITLAYDLEIPFDTIAHALANFKGIERRFSFQGTFQGAEIFDDYGHHPKEIDNTLVVARNRTQGKLIAIFQPHRYSRTARLWHEFVETLSSKAIDHLIITDIYPASEQPRPSITSQRLAQDIQEKASFPVSYIPYDADFSHIIAHVQQIAMPEDLILLQGAGRINKLATILVGFAKTKNT